jgi:hypothetical protein
MRKGALILSAALFVVPAIVQINRTEKAGR